ncbi:MAG: hypothetical protein KF730_17440 [Sphingomonas sp.]|uniref:hypothetical protein n=1 Tax=Sphingomonas sp. TaxID=28214 RepID=UPI0025E0570B|nr:hypothetical protein [Sphingomonas sp.]MBX3566345.1 hypothetical protein [Sphingomonas sp.]
MAMRFIASAAAAMLLLGAPVAQAQLAIGHDIQLLLDDHVIASRTGLSKVQERPGTGQIVLRADAPWEQRVFYPTVMRLPNGVFRMYYNAGLISDPTFNIISMAESRDGVHFRRTPADNIVFRDAHGPSFAYDPRDGAAPWRMVYFGPNNGMGAATSRDGTNFDPVASNPILINKADTQQSVVWDPAVRKWVMFTRYWEKPADGRAAWPWFKNEIRSVARSESSDFIHWSPLEVVIRRGREDPALSDFYGLQVTMRHGVMIGLLWTSDWDDTSGRLGRQRAQLVVSRDHGRTWSRVDPETMFFDLGAPGSFDSKIVWPSSIVTAGDRELIYYLAANRDHGADPIPTFPRDKYSIGVRTIARDRFVALVAGDTEGRLSTRQVIVPSMPELRLNAKVQPGGYLRVWATRADGRVLARGVAPAGDRISAAIVWQQGSLRSLTGQLVTIHFAFRNAALYSFRL